MKETISAFFDYLTSLTYVLLTLILTFSAVLVVNKLLTVIFKPLVCLLFVGVNI